jgi:hypothetical protein
MTIDPEIRSGIAQRLDRLERDFGVDVFFACESGSRAWDFASLDSDYDVRFLYRHPRDWYLSLVEGRDVIETPIDGVYDVNGWDLRKALRLAAKGNPVLFEWLSSPIRYVDTPLARRFCEAASAAFDPLKAYHHYLSMARSQKRAYLGGATVRQKKYFYAVRPLLACLYLLERRDPVPMKFFDLAGSVTVPTDVRSALDVLLQAKRQASEAAEGGRLAVLDAWIDSTLERLESQPPPAGSVDAMKELEAFFRSAVDIQLTADKTLIVSAER